MSGGTAPGENEEKTKDNGSMKEARECGHTHVFDRRNESRPNATRGIKLKGFKFLVYDVLHARLQSESVVLERSQKTWNSQHAGVTTFIMRIARSPSA